MNKYLYLLSGILMISSQKAFCITESISPELEQSLKVHSNEPSVMMIIFALVIVISLIYVTGLIYSKLNIVGAKTVQEHLKNYDLSKVVVLSTTQLGQGKNLHVIEINNKRFLIGATPNSINLIKELGENQKKVEKPEEPEKSAEFGIEHNPMDIIYDKDKPEINVEPLIEFDIHKKYL